MLRASDAVRAVSEQEPALILLDNRLPDRDGLELLQELSHICPVIMLTAHGAIYQAVHALKLGACDYLTKPIRPEELELAIERALDHAQLKRSGDFLKTRLDLLTTSPMVGTSPVFNEVRRQIGLFGPTDATVLILGESGVGKELVARAIHNLSPRSKRPFVAINCGGMSEGTIESELFGHVKGAFTGAVIEREGKFEYAAGGTLLLDEVGEMPLATQIKLLRVLEERSVVRLGDNKLRPVDVRVLAATNADLLQKVKDGTFRQDLYFRLKVVTIDLPPLRERRSDIKLLIEHFLRHFCKLHGKDVDSIDRDALVALVQYDWPGNVRELRNAVESMVVRAKGNILTRADLPPEIWAPLPTDQDGWQFLAGRTWPEVERNHIRVSLELTAGNRQKAARAMGLSERTLYRKIKEYGL